MAFTKNDEAVSPVIGVILMVAVTVILAAVIAAFVFGMAGNLQKGKTVAVTAVRSSSTNIVCTNMGGQDVGSLTTAIAITGDVTTSNLAKTVGSTVTVVTASSTNAHVLATGTFTDGSSTVLLDTYV